MTVRLFPLRPAICVLLLSGCGGPRLRPAPAASRGTEPAVRFIETAAAAGIRFRHTHGGTGRRFFPETMGSGCVFFDADGDGWADALLLNGGPLPPAGASAGGPTAALFLNNRNGTFRDATRGSGLDVPFYAMGCAAGDYDNDGREDLYLTGALGRGRLFRGLGGGRFRDVTRSAGVVNAGHWGTSCAWLDIDEDGLLDLFICNYARYTLARDRPCLEAGERVYCRPTAYPPDHCTLYRNRGDGTFADVSRSSGIAAHPGYALGVATWDFDEDGRLDVMVANDLAPNLLFRSLGGGRFEETGLDLGVALGEDGRPRAGMGIDAVDFRGDGHPAIAISNFSTEPLSFFLREAPGVFTDVTYAMGTGESHLALLGFGLFFFDADNDGRHDLFVANGHIEPRIAEFGERTAYAQRKQVYWHRPDGTLEDLGDRAGPDLAAPRVSRGAAWADYDRDGDLDVLVSNNNGPAELLRNDSPSRRWIELRLQGVGRGGANRNGIGGRVRLRSGSAAPSAMVRSGSSYCSQSELVAHFGLGSSNEAVDVEVAWPSRRGQMLHLKLAPGRRWLVREDRPEPIEEKR